MQCWVAHLHGIAYRVHVDECRCSICVATPESTEPLKPVKRTVSTYTPLDAPRSVHVLLSTMLAASASACARIVPLICLFGTVHQSSK